MSGVDKLLSANEKIVWRGKPVKKAFLLSGLMAIPIGLIFLSFFIFWMWSTASMGAPFSFIIFGLPVLGIGLAVTLGPFLFQILRYRNTES